ncbi:MAG TPA: PilZ domain-containing protein [Candidatus Hydrogenedentes bacterium]|nr:PilZ domain-containing protein [Candidatus Hydrogenedentota bacterium]HPG67051.1 PilZ domain-containing protein [Candidatus Hydrogenedentota bacterium]
MVRLIRGASFRVEGEDMTDRGSSIDTYMRVGSWVVLDLEPSKKGGTRFRTTIVGWSKPDFVTLKRPVHLNRLVPLQHEQRCVLRFLCEGNACAFDSTIMDFTSQLEDASLRIAWPQDFERVPFRKSERIGMTFPCEIAMGDKRFSGEVRDISVGGCGVYTSRVVAEKTTIKLTFTLPNCVHLEDVEAIVRSVHPQSTGTFFGCEFAEGQEQVQNDVCFFVRYKLDRRDAGENEDAQQAVIIDEDAPSAEALRQAFEHKGWNVFATPTTLDGLSRLRAFPPSMLIINQEQSDLPGMEAARLVKATHGFDNLRIFIFSRRLVEVEKLASQMGAIGFYCSPFAPNQICDAAVSCAGKARVLRASPKAPPRA